MSDPFGTDHLAPLDEDLLEALVRQVIGTADMAVLTGTHRTRADETRAAVRAAIANAVRNGAITIAPREDWPEWWALDAGVPGYR